jgi:hypothetical protein
LRSGNNRPTHSLLIESTYRSANAFRLGLIGGDRTAFTPLAFKMGRSPAPLCLKNSIQAQKLEDRGRLIGQAVDCHHAAVLFGLLAQKNQPAHTATVDEAQLRHIDDDASRPLGEQSVD